MIEDVPGLMQRSHGHRRLENGLRAVAWIALLGLAWGSIADRRLGGWAVERLNGATDLSPWTHMPAAARLHVELRAAPTDVERDWLAGLLAAGDEVSWSGEVPPVAATAEPVSDPAGGTVIRVAVRPGGSVFVADGLGALDSARAGRGGVVLGLPATPGSVEVTAEDASMTTRLADSLDRRGVVVLGAAGWEAKFLIAALEERGYAVDARLVLAPGIATTQGRPLPLDTARHAVAIALDSSAGRYAAALARFARGGGGVVLGPEAAGRPAFATWAPGSLPVPLRASPPVPLTLRERGDDRGRAERLLPTGPEPRRGLALRPVVLRAGAVALEVRDTSVAIGARRLGAGRVIQVGYADTWRWRMTGDDGAVEAHRGWWAGIVAAASYRPSVPRTVQAGAAPRAELVAALGPASPSPSPTAPPGRAWPLALGVLVSALLAEWALRRVRGAA